MDILFVILQQPQHQPQQQRQRQLNQQPKVFQTLFSLRCFFKGCHGAKKERKEATCCSDAWKIADSKFDPIKQFFIVMS